MEYLDFSKRAQEEGFKYPDALFMLAYVLDIVDYESFFSNCAEDYDYTFCARTYDYNGRHYYIMNEYSEELCVSFYRNIALQKAMNDIDEIYHPYMKFKEYSEYVYMTLYDIFDHVTEVDLDLDKVVFPKIYVIEC